MANGTGTAPAATTAVLSLTPPLKAIQACQRGDVRGLVEAFGNDALALAAFAVEIRRESVCALGDYEVFRRNSPNGSLRMVMRPVTLSLQDGTLYQITKNQKKDGVWEEVPVGDPDRATVSYPGMLAINAVAGCAVGQPPTVFVDGAARTNPYVERAVRKDGRPGNIQRIVIAVTVVGPAPATGNPVVVNYTLDYDPSKDLAHMFARVAKNNPKSCYLANEDEVVAAPQPGWAFLPLSDGVGFYYDLRHEDILAAYRDYVNIQGQALKKAQTVARRNAMKSHPAVGGIAQSVVVNQRGCARVLAIGWAPDDNRDLQRWQEIQERLARGMELPSDSDIQVVGVSDAYDVETHSDPVPAAKPAPTAVELTPEQAERNKLIEYIDQGVGLLSTDQVGELDYDPAAPLEELRRVRAALDALMESDGGAS